MKAWRLLDPRLWAALAIALLTALALGPEILAGRFWAAGDGLTQNLPHRVIAAASLWAGELPFWNPYVFAGVPFFATIQPGVLFFGNAPFLFLPAALAQDLVVGLAVAGAIGGVAAFVRALGLPWLAALFGGVAFGLGGFVTMHVEHVQMAQIAALTPWLLWAIERHARTGAARHALAAALLVAGMVLAGSPQLTAYGLGLAAAYALFRLVQLPREAKLPFAVRGVAAGAIGLGLAACQLLPTLDLIAGTQRAGLGPYAFTFDSLPPTGLAGLFAPYLFGARAPAWPVGVPWWGVPAWQGFLDGYVGVATLLLAGLALSRLRAWPQVAFWAAVALVALVLALGSYTPAAHLVAQLPVLNAMRYPYRHLFEFTLALAVLGAHGLAWLQRLHTGPFADSDADRQEAAHRARALGRAALPLGALGLALVAGLALGGQALAARLQPFMRTEVDLAAALSPLAPGAWLPLALVALATLAAWRLARTGDDRWAIGLITVLACDLLAYGQLQGLGFVLPARPTAPISAPWPERAAGRELTVPLLRYPNCYGCDVLGHLRRFRYPNVAAFDGLATVNGYDAFIPARYGRLLGMDSFGHAGELDAGAVFGASHHALDLLGCRTLRLEAPLATQGAWPARLATARWARRPDADGFVVLGNPRARPPGWRVARARVLAEDAVDAAVRGEAPFDPAAEALLDAGTALPAAGTALPGAPRAGFAPGPVVTRWQDRTTLAVETRGPGPGLVVVSEGFDPGWSATLLAGEGAPRALPVHRADALLLAVAVPAGEVEVALTYRPRRWALGLGITLAALAAWLAALLLALRPQGARPACRWTWRV